MPRGEAPCNVIDTYIYVYMLILPCIYIYIYVTLNAASTHDDVNHILKPYYVSVPLKALYIYIYI